METSNPKVWRNEWRMIQKFRKKPIVIEAIQFEYYHKIIVTLKKFVGANMGTVTKSNNSGAKATFAILTLEGYVFATEGDWIIKGINGEFYPCKPDIFKKTYDNIEGQDKHRCPTCGKIYSSQYKNYICNECKKNKKLMKEKK